MSSDSETGPDSPPRVELRVRTEDQGAEIFVIDSHLALRERGRGQLHASLPQGIYKLKVLAGGESQEELVSLKGPGPVEKTFRARDLRFAAPCPVPESATSHEYHQEVVAEESRRVRPGNQIGSGSWILVMARVWSPPESDSRKENPLGRFTLRTPDGRTFPLADRARVELYPSDPKQDPCAVCVVETNPGVHRLIYHHSDDQRLARSIVAVRDWQTQAFLLTQVNPSSTREVKTTLFMTHPRLDGSPIPNFDPYDPNCRLVELAAQGLAEERQVLSEPVVQRIEAGDFHDPMLAIYAAHLLLLKTERTFKASLPKAVARLRSLVGDDHPDVEALALKAEGQRRSYRFRYPPMLRRSWDLVVEASNAEPDLTPKDSFALEVSDRLISDEPWLTWREPAPAAASHFDPEARFDPHELGVFEEILLGHTRPTSRSLKPPNFQGHLAESAHLESVMRSSRALEALDSPSPRLDAEQMAKMVRILGIPRNKVEEKLSRLYPTGPDVRQTSEGTGASASGDR